MVSRIRIGPEGGPFVEIDEDNGTLKFDAPSGNIDLQANDLLSLGDLDLSGSQLQNAVLLGATLGGALNADGQDIENIATVRSDDIENDQTVTTQDLVVNGTATGPFGGGGIVLEAGDSITVRSLNAQTTDGGFVTLYSGGAKDVLGGVINGGFQGDFLYEFTDATTIRKNGTGTNYSGAFTNNGFNKNDVNMGDIEFLPPARDVVKIRVGAKIAGGFSFGADVILKD
jgi:hypothetical protein